MFAARRTILGWEEYGASQYEYALRNRLLESEFISFFDNDMSTKRSALFDL